MKDAPDDRNLQDVQNPEGLSRRRFLLGTLLSPSAVPLLGTAAAPAQHHADVNVADSGGNSPLLHAAMRGRITAVRLLPESGANVNAAFKHGWTPLMAAAWEGDATVVAELLKHGANATVVNSERRSALMLAESEGHRAVVKLPVAR